MPADLRTGWGSDPVRVGAKDFPAARVRPSSWEIAAKQPFAGAFVGPLTNGTFWQTGPSSFSLVERLRQSVRGFVIGAINRRPSFVAWTGFSTDLVVMPHLGSSQTRQPARKRLLAWHRSYSSGTIFGSLGVTACTSFIYEVMFELRRLVNLDVNI